MTDDNLCACGRPTRNSATVCETCGDQLARALGDVPWLDGELETSTSRQQGIDYRRVGGGSGGKKPAERPLPVSWAPSEARTHLKALLVSWVRLCAAEDVRNSSPHPGLPDDNLPAISRWLMWRIDGLLLHDAGHDAVEEITDAVAKCHRLIDRPADQEFYGPCECGRDLYAKPNAPQVKCRACDRTYDTAEMAEWMRAQVVGRLMTLREACAVLGKMELPVPLETLKTWAKRNKFPQRGTNLEGVPVYLIEDMWEHAGKRSA